MRSFFTLLIVFACLAITRISAHAADADTEARISRLAALLATDASFKVRAYAARQLGTFASIGAKKHPEITRALSAALRDTDPIVRAIAADALGKHEATSAIKDLEKLARTDESDVVRRSSAEALKRLQQNTEVVPVVETSMPRMRRAQRVELGRVELDAGSPLLGAITDAVEALIEPHRPAMFPRESPDVRFEVVVKRVAPLVFEARVLVMQLPGAHLRQASNAKASAKTTSRSARAISKIERELALTATTRAVTEALAMLDD
jgi:hypothetical protein